MLKCKANQRQCILPFIPPYQFRDRHAITYHTSNRGPATFFTSDSFSCECRSECYSIGTSSDVSQHIKGQLQLRTLHRYPTSKPIPPNTCNRNQKMSDSDKSCEQVAPVCHLPVGFDATLCRRGCYNVSSLTSIVRSAGRRGLLGGDPSDGHGPRPGVL